MDGLTPDALQPPEQKRCSVWIHGPFTLAVQAMLALVSFGTLVLKWRCERQRRTRAVFAFDATKLAVSSGLGAHGLNIVCATLLTSRARSVEGKDADECAWCVLPVRRVVAAERDTHAVRRAGTS